MAYKKETKTVWLFKSEIDRISNSKLGIQDKLRKKLQVECAMDMTKNHNEISGRAYGILLRYLEKNIPKNISPPILYPND
jgi:hypothetical protein